MKNILILHGSSDLYGASKILLTTVKILVAHGYQVTVVLSENGPLVDELNKLPVRVIIHKLGILRRKYFTPRGLLNRMRALRKAYQEVNRIVSDQNINLIYSNTTAVLVGAFVARRRKIKHIWHIHEIIKSPRFLVKFLSFLLDRYASCIIVVSNEVKSYWEKTLKADNITVIHNGIDYDEYQIKNDLLRIELNIPEDRVVIGMIGRINGWKGQGYFLKIASELRAKYKNLEFVMAGDSFPGYEYLLDDLKLEIKKAGLEDSLHLLGFRNDIPNILSSLDIFILPSVLPDPFPTVILEAMASAKPVVATNHGGAIEMIEHNQSGILIPFNNAAEAASKVEPLIRDRAKRALMGRNGRSRVLEEFSLTNYENSLLRITDALI